MKIIQNHELWGVDAFVWHLQKHLKGHNFNSMGLTIEGHPFESNLCISTGLEYIYLPEAQKVADLYSDELVFNTSNIPKRVEHLLVCIRKSIHGTGMSFQDVEMTIEDGVLIIGKKWDKWQT